MYNKFHEEYLQIIDKNMPYKVLPKKERNLNENLGYPRQY